MNGIMRKRLIALLSAAGFAGTAAYASGQVLKGSDQGQNTQTENTIKASKNRQENAAGKNAAGKKLHKGGAEQKASRDVVTEKIGKDHTTHRSTLDASSKDASKIHTTTGGKGAAHPEAITVKQKTTAKTDAASKDAKSKQGNAKTQ